MRLLPLVVIFLSACSNSYQNSATKTVNLDQTEVKWQSIGNCWAYATMGWVESLVLKNSGKKIHLNLSESYHTYRHFEEQLTSRTPLGSIQTGGMWNQSMQLIAKYGLMKEEDFIPSEATNPKSDSQLLAMNNLNTWIKEGKVKSNLSKQQAEKHLDAAFNVNLSEVNSKIISPRSLMVGPNTTLQDLIYRWRDTPWPSYTQYAPPTSALPQVPPFQTPDRDQLLRRVFLALNDHQPVVISWFVDFNAVGEDGAFNKENLIKNGAGSQGYHQTVIEDYVVSGIDPQTGKKFYVGEGEATPYEKWLAAYYGKLEYFVIKNSWGSDRPDRPSYEREGEKGYHKLNASYVLSWLKETKEGSSSRATPAVQGFILPPGF